MQQGRPPRRGLGVGAVAGIAVVILAILAVIALWALSSSNGGSIVSLVTGPAATPVPPTATPAPSSTPRPGIAIQVPGPEGTPTTLPITLPSVTIPTIVIPTLPIPIPIAGAPGSNPTAPPAAKLTVDQARQKVRDTVGTCQLLQVQIDLALVTYEAPNWLVKLPISGASWTVNDTTGAVTPDERAAERQRNCRL
jgi:hypothetical protein